MAFVKKSALIVVVCITCGFLFFTAMGCGLEQGTYTYGDGSEYVGQLKNGMPHGQGTKTSAAGGIEYVGEFKDGKYHGKGTLIYTGVIGNFTFTYVGESEEDYLMKYVGEWKDDKKHGQGTFTWADGPEYVGGWKDDDFHGQGAYTLADGTVKKGKWNDGEFVGE